MKQLCIVVFIISLPLFGNTHWSLEFNGALPYNPTLPLTVAQKGYPDLHFNARFASQPLTPPICWVWRIGKWRNNKAWELEAIHHKLYLQNSLPEIQEFSISHGYNITTVNKAVKYPLFKKHTFILRLGAGIVFAHPENTIRNHYFSPHNGLFELGYYITGPVLNMSIGHRFKITKLLFINAEAKFTPSYSTIPLSEGRAYLWNLPLLLTCGIGINIAPNPPSR